MPRVFGEDLTRAELLARVGDVAQVAEVRLAELSDGPGRGVRVAEVLAGRLRLTVLVDRGLDIGAASLDGMPLAWASSTGVVHPAFYEAAGSGWLRGFGGGLMTTCGLTSVGAPGADEEGPAEMHGRASWLPARLSEAGGRWEGDDYVLTVAGQTREAALFGWNLALTRRISVRLGELEVHVDDVVENLGDRPAPLMLLYHCNFGFPLVAPGSRILAPRPSPRDADALAGLGSFAEVVAPERGYREQVFFCAPEPGPDGLATAAVVNPAAGGVGLAGFVRFDTQTLPNLVVWKQLGQGAYVVGLEPANCLVMGRADERRRGTLERLAPGESRAFRVRLGAARGPEEIARALGGAA